MKKKIVTTICIIMYSAALIFSSFLVGRTTADVSSNNVLNVSEETEEEYYTAKENKGKLTIYKGDTLLMSLDTNIEFLPSVVRAQLKKGIEFKASDLPGLLEAFAE